MDMALVAKSHNTKWHRQQKAILSDSGTLWLALSLSHAVFVCVETCEYVGTRARHIAIWVTSNEKYYFKLDDMLWREQMWNAIICDGTNRPCELSSCITKWMGHFCCCQLSTQRRRPRPPTPSSPAYALKKMVGHISAYKWETARRIKKGKKKRKKKLFNSRTFHALRIYK